jgi:hypothetical protein
MFIGTHRLSMAIYHSREMTAGFVKMGDSPLWVYESKRQG